MSKIERKSLCSADEGVNDCHTVVNAVIDKCHEETIAKALEDDAASHPGNRAVQVAR